MADFTGNLIASTEEVKDILRLMKSEVIQVLAVKDNPINNFQEEGVPSQVDIYCNSLQIAQQYSKFYQIADLRKLCFAEEETKSFLAKVSCKDKSYSHHTKG